MRMIHASQTYETNTVTPLIVTVLHWPLTFLLAGCLALASGAHSLLPYCSRKLRTHFVTVLPLMINFCGPMDTGPGVVFSMGKAWTPPGPSYLDSLSLTHAKHCLRDLSLIPLGPQFFSLLTMFSHFSSLFPVTLAGCLAPKGFLALEMHCSEVSSSPVILVWRQCHQPRWSYYFKGPITIYWFQTMIRFN